MALIIIIFTMARLNFYSSTRGYSCHNLPCYCASIILCVLYWKLIIVSLCSLIAMVWIFVSHTNVEILVPNVIELGGRAFDRWLGYKDRTLMNAINVLMKETPQSYLAPSTTWGHSKKTVIYEPGIRPSSVT